MVSKCFSSKPFAKADMSSIHSCNVSPLPSPITRGSLISSQANIDASSRYDVCVTVFVRDSIMDTNCLNQVRHMLDVKKSSRRRNCSPFGPCSPAACAHLT